MTAAIALQRPRPQYVCTSLTEPGRQKNTEASLLTRPWCGLVLVVGTGDLGRIGKLEASRKAHVPVPSRPNLAFGMTDPRAMKALMLDSGFQSAR